MPDTLASGATLLRLILPWPFDGVASLINNDARHACAMIEPSRITCLLACHRADVWNQHVLDMRVFHELSQRCDCDAAYTLLTFTAPCRSTTEHGHGELGSAREAGGA